LNAVRRKLVDEIYRAALALSGAEREALLEERTKGDPVLHQHLLSLLQASEASDERLADRFSGIRERLWKALLAKDDDSEEDLSGQRVGVWLIEERIARGGLATVYLAHRDDGTFDQTVALKVLRRGLDTDDVIARFRVERQILSALDHPAITQILDGGALDDGRPYLVLEYVDGLPITTYCQKNNVSIRDRVVLLIDVLRALHHAHKHLVVHRDVKPSNILISTDGHVALLDFGIAKLLDPRSLPGASMMTRTGVSLLTPSYASPEQHAGHPVSTASDIYQVGLVMYELLTGKQPFNAPNQRESGRPWPSRELRGTPQYKLVRGDLDAITLKAMHVDPAQRYASADEMVLDLTRYLDGLPVIARPDTLGYRFAKLAKRRPWLVPAVAISLLGVAAYVATLTIYSTRLAREERLAAASQQFMVDLFRSPDPYAPADEERGRDITVVEALRIGQERLRSDLGDQPELKASLLASISDVYGSLDQGDDAIELREEALELQRQIYGNRSGEVIASLRFLGGQYEGKGDLDRADKLFDEQLALAGELFDDDDPQLGLAEVASGKHEEFKGDTAPGRELMLAGVEKLRQAPEQYAQTLITTLIALAEQYGMESEESAFGAIEEAQNVANSVFGPDSLQAALVRIRLASSMTIFGDYESSEQNFKAAIPVLESRLGENNSTTLSALNNLGYLYNRRNDYANAERIHRELLERQIEKHGPVHRAVADSYQNLAGAITQLGRYDESIPLHRKAYEIYKAVLNDDNYIIAFPLLSTAYAELQRHNAMAAEAAAREALARFEASVPGTFFEGVARCLLGLALEQEGSNEKGNALVESSHALMKTGSIPDPYPALCGVTRP
jgi:eukaryotic-like serine/threonine-protein kinase